MKTSTFLVTILYIAVVAIITIIIICVFVLRPEEATEGAAVGVGEETITADEPKRMRVTGDITIAPSTLNAPVLCDKCQHFASRSSCTMRREVRRRPTGKTGTIDVAHVHDGGTSPMIVGLMEDYIHRVYICKVCRELQENKQ